MEVGFIFGVLMDVGGFRGERNDGFSFDVSNGGGRERKCG